MNHAFDDAIDRLQTARIRAEYRKPLLEETRAALESTLSVTLDGDFQSGRSIRLTETARLELSKSIDAELAEIAAELIEAEKALKTAL